MIDWQIQINGHNPPGWDQHRDGCWFPDFDHQSYLLPFFDVGDSPIDPYGGTRFQEADLRRLREHLRYHQPEFEGKADSWTVTETSGNQSTVIRLERKKVLSVIGKTLEMIECALESGGTFIFRGD
jgi:hypothetical protein